MEGRKAKKSCNNKKLPFVAMNVESAKLAVNETSTHPKMILKAKENKASEKPEATIILATKPTRTKIDQKLQQKEVSKHGVIQINSAMLSTMTKPVNLITFHSILNLHAFDYLQENNSDFMVVGAIGTQRTGKSTILNILADNHEKEDILRQNNWVFSTKNLFSQVGTSFHEDEVQMFITKNRIFLLDSAPVLLNHVKKDFIVSELEDIKTILLLLSVCHVLVVMQEDYLNLNFIRLLLCAEMMNQHERKDLPKIDPKIIFVKNKSNRKQIESEEKMFYENIYKKLFKNSKLNIFSNEGDREKINMMLFPDLNNGSCLFTDDGRYVSSMRMLRQRVFMTQTPDCAKGEEILTEKSWSQMIITILEGYNNNYFLRKYENLKEKYNLHNHVNVVENASKEKNYTNFVN